MSTSALSWAARYVIMWNIRKHRNAAWETEVGMRWNLRQVCQVRWAYQIIPSNRFWITRCDWVTTINKVTWVQANWNAKHKQTHTQWPPTYRHTHTNSEWTVEMLSIHQNNDDIQYNAAHIKTNTITTWFSKMLIDNFNFQMLIQKTKAIK